MMETNSVGSVVTETLLIVRPQQHDVWRSRCCWSLKQRHTMATTEEDCEQTDGPTHGSLSVKPGCSYMVRKRDERKMNAEMMRQILKSRLAWLQVRSKRGMPSENYTTR